ILFELREHSAGLNAGRWDYIFSVIKKLGHRPEFVLPDRGDVTMAVPFMRSYCELLVKTCHARGAFAMGGMGAFIPSGRGAAVNGNGAVAINNLMEDAATAEISRSQIWQWLHHGRVTAEDVRREIAAEADRLGPGYEEATALFDQIATHAEYVEFLTVPAY